MATSFSAAVGLPRGVGEMVTEKPPGSNSTAMAAAARNSVASMERVCIVASAIVDRRRARCLRPRRAAPWPRHANSLSQCLGKGSRTTRPRQGATA